MRFLTFGAFTRSKFQFFAKISVRVVPSRVNREVFRSVVRARLDSFNLFMRFGKENDFVFSSWIVGDSSFFMMGSRTSSVMAFWNVGCSSLGGIFIFFELAEIGVAIAFFSWDRV